MTFRCFYCDRITADPASVRIRLNTGRLSCADCSAHDAPTLTEQADAERESGRISTRIDPDAQDGIYDEFGNFIGTHAEVFGPDDEGCAVCGVGPGEPCLPDDEC